MKLQSLVDDHSSRYREDQKFDLEQLMRAGNDVIRYIRSIPELQDVQFVYNEYPLFEVIDREDDVQMKFKGYIDLVLSGKDKRGKTILWICDFKTCSWGWDRETREDRWKQFQLFLYKYFFCKKFDLDPRQVRTAFILLKKRPPKGGSVEFFPVSAGPVSVQRALDTLGSNITEMIEREKSGTLLKDRTQCKNKFGEVCPFFNTLNCPGE